MRALLVFLLVSSAFAVTGNDRAVVLPASGTVAQTAATLDAIGQAMGWGGSSAPAWGAITGTLANQADLQAALNAKGTSNFSGAYADLTGKPTLFDGIYASLTGKPVLGTAAATAATDYATAAQGTLAGTALQPAGNGSALTGLTKAQVGLANADNTSDASKPVSTATQTALDAKQATLVSATNIKTINGSTVLGSGDLVVGGAVAWGGVTGTLSNQTDLQNALNAKLATTATTAAVNDSANRRYVTDAQLTVIGNTSGTNSGDQTSVTGNAGTATTLQTPRNINGVAFNGSANVTVTAAGSTLSDNVPVSKLNSGTSASNTTYWRGDGTWATPAGGSSAVSYVKLTSDLAADGSTSLSDATGLSFAVTAGVYYSYKFTVIYQTAATTTGIGLSVNYPAATVASAYATITGFAADGAAAEFTGAITAANDTVLSTAVAAANTAYVAVIEGTLLPSASGTLVVRKRTEIAASNMIVKQASSGELVTLP